MAHLYWKIKKNTLTQYLRIALFAIVLNAELPIDNHMYYFAHGITALLKAVVL